MDGFKRITPSVLVATGALVEAHKQGNEVHGWGLIQVTGLGASTLYDILDKFEANRLVEARWEKQNSTPGRPPRRLYRLNENGLPPGAAAPCRTLTGQGCLAAQTTTPRVQG